MEEPNNVPEPAPKPPKKGPAKKPAPKKPVTDKVDRSGDALQDPEVRRAYEKELAKLKTELDAQSSTIALVRFVDSVQLGKTESFIKATEHITLSRDPHGVLITTRSKRVLVPWANISAIELGDE